MQKISAVLIMKNEEALLPRCLDSLKGVDEIILVDTGSQDNTKEVAKRYVDTVYDFPWIDDFAAARNFALSKATGDWVISIDCDEFLHDFSKLREAVELAEAQSALAITVRMIAEDNGQWFLFPRVFKKCPQVWWEGAIHNHISVVGADIVDANGQPLIEITHGYSPAHLLDPERAFRILKKEVERTGNGREMFYLGREYWYRRDYENAIITLGKYVQQSRYLAEKADAFLIMARAYWAIGKPDDARDALMQAIVINSNFKEAIKFMAVITGDGSGNARWQANADQWLRLAETANNEDVLFIRDA